MTNKTHTLMLLMVIALPLGCSRGALHEDYAKSVHYNTVQQTVNISAPQESHPEVKMDGQKAVDVVDNYRKESPKAESTDLTSEVR